MVDTVTLHDGNSLMSNGRSSGLSHHQHTCPRNAQQSCARVATLLSGVPPPLLRGSAAATYLLLSAARSSRRRGTTDIKCNKLDSFSSVTLVLINLLIGFVANVRQGKEMSYSVFNTKCGFL